MNWTASGAKSVAILVLVIFFCAQCAEEQTTATNDEWSLRIRDALKSLREEKDTLSIVQRWIQQPSLPGSEQGQQRLIAEELRKLNFDQIESFEVDDISLYKQLSKHFHTARDSLKGSPIVVGILKGAAQVRVSPTAEQQAHIDSTSSSSISSSTSSTSTSTSTSSKGRSVILNGHIDVVPIGDQSQWKRDPWSGHYDNVTDRIHGRGSTDMKGGIFSSLLALMALKRMNIKLAGDVLFESVIEEESGGAGTMATVIKGFRADAAIIPEPTKMKIFPKQQGSTWFRVTVKGIAAHGGTRYEGISAIEKASQVVQLMGELEQARNKRIMDQDEMYRVFLTHRNISIPVPINVGVIKGGKWPSSVADEVILEGRLGVAPSETLEQARAEMHHALTVDLVARDPFFSSHPVLLEFFGGQWVPGNVEVDAPVTESLARAYRLFTKQEPIIEASPWATDGGYLTAHGVPAVIFGPGDTELAHQTDETVSVANIFACAGVIARMLIDFCGIATAAN